VFELSLQRQKTRRHQLLLQAPCQGTVGKALCYLFYQRHSVAHVAYEAGKLVFTGVLAETVLPVARLAPADQTIRSVSIKYLRGRATKRLRSLLILGGRSLRHPPPQCIAV
jgi:hypothetical protein